MRRARVALLVLTVAVLAYFAISDRSDGSTALRAADVDVTVVTTSESVATASTTTVVHDDGCRQ